MFPRKEIKPKLAKGLLSKKTTQFVLIGVLLCLFSLICLTIRTSFVGYIFSYVFVYLFGAAYLLAMLINMGFGLYFIIKRQAFPWKWNLTTVFAIILVFFALTAFSDNNISLANVFAEYSQNFLAAQATRDFATLFSSGVKGGIIGHLSYSFLATIISPLGARIIYLLGIIAGLFFVLKPLAYYLGEKFVHRNDSRDAKDRRIMSQRQRKWSQIMGDDSQKIFIDQRMSESDESESTLAASGVEVQDAQPLVSTEEVKPEQHLRGQKSATSLGSKSAMDVFKNSPQDFAEQTPPLSKTPTSASTASHSFDIFKSKPIDEELVNNDNYQEVDVSATISPFDLNKKKNPNTQGGVFMPYPVVSKTAVDQVEEVHNVVEDFYDESKAYQEPESLHAEGKAPISFVRPTVEEQRGPHLATSSADLFEKRLESTSEKPDKPSQTKVVFPQPTAVNKNKVYLFPGLELLDNPKLEDTSKNIDEARVNQAKLDNKLNNLGIKAHVSDFIVAPAFTQYEVEVASDFKVAQFQQIKNDIMMALSAEKVNILTPIPGKDVVGIEVPNKTRSTVSFKEVMARIPEKNRNAILLAALGKDVSDRVVTINLAKAPHLLIAGATNSGKSVCMNTIIISILMRCNPDDVKLILIDPKWVEFANYEGIPHLLCPIINKVNEAEIALQKVVEEMEKRYLMFRGSHVAKTIEEYNAYAISNGIAKMPYLIVIIDELNDLMTLSGKSIETCIQRITSLARAAGIHLIVATQRPSVDVITGVIKANIPSRIAFAVSSNVDSRTILDGGGAEELLGMGDMLLHMSGENEKRVQGAFVSNEEVLRIVDFVKKQRAPEYDQNFLDLKPKVQEQMSFGEDFGEDDSFIISILEEFIDQPIISISLLQRKFGMGFPKAAKTMDTLEKLQLVGAPRGSKPREVFQQAISQYLAEHGGVNNNES